MDEKEKVSLRRATRATKKKQGRFRESKGQEEIGIVNGAREGTPEKGIFEKKI